MPILNNGAARRHQTASATKVKNPGPGDQVFNVSIKPVPRKAEPPEVRPHKKIFIT